MEMRARQVLRSLMAPLLVGILLCGMLVVAPSAAQSGSAAPQVILTDKKDDQKANVGQLVTTPPPFANVDLLAVSAAQPAQGTLALTVTTKAAATATENVTLHFAVTPGPTSLPNSTATNQTYSLLYHDKSVSGLPGATAAATGADLIFTIPLSAIHAVGGDTLVNVTVATDDYVSGPAVALHQDDANATDRAPDPGSDPSVPYIFTRPGIAGNILLAVTGGSYASLEPGAAAATTKFIGASATIGYRQARVTFELQATNRGIDPDRVTLAVPPVLGTDLSLTPSSLSLGPGESARAALTVTLTNATSGTLHFAIMATSANGGATQVEVVIIVAVALPPQERTPVPGALGFLSPLVTSVGLEKVFGDFAELAFLLFSVLLVVVVVYLLMFTVQTPWVRVRVTPKRVVVAPGGVAEFHVEIEGGKKHPALARATLRTQGLWSSGLQVGRAAARVGESMDIPLESGRDALPQEAVLRVQVPYDAPARDKQELEFDVVPVDAEGGTYPKHATRAKISVEAAAPAVGKYASARDIRLADVAHDPPDPRPGATVRTTATIHNDGPVVARLRVVLQKEGKPVAEERIDVPPHDSKTVALPWTAGVGRNLVKVQIFLA